MKSSLMKLNHVSTFLGKGQVEIQHLTQSCEVFHLAVSVGNVK
jgi:hypothetical protein